MEELLSVEDNNNILSSIKPFQICFQCKQHRLMNFMSFYTKMTKHERMKCLLCVSGSTKIQNNNNRGHDLNE